MKMYVEPEVSDDQDVRVLLHPSYSPIGIYLKQYGATVYAVCSCDPVGGVIIKSLGGVREWKCNVCRQTYICYGTEPINSSVIHIESLTDVWIKAFTQIMDTVTITYVYGEGA